MNETVEKKTRQVFDSIHRAQIARPATKERLRQLITTDFLHVPEDFFEGKISADLGCGSGVHGTINLLNLGAALVKSMDLDESIVEPATRELEPDFSGRYSLHIGSVLELPFDDGEFDFFICDGVLHHLADRGQAVKELFRVLKPGGSGTIMVAGNGGLMHRFVFECARDEYRNNETLASFVDGDPGASVEWLRQQLERLKGEVGYHGPDGAQQSIQFLEGLGSLIDEDLMLTIKDRVRSPINYGLTHAEMTSHFRAANFADWTRLTRRVPFSNLRKILGPLYYHQDHPLAKLLYGDGSRLHYLVTK